MEKKSKMLPVLIVICVIVILIIVGVIIGVKTLWKDAEPTQAQDQTQVAAQDTLETIATLEEIPEAEPSIQEIAAQYLPEGNEFEHKVLQGSFGSWQDAIIFFYKEKDCFQCRWYSKVLIEQKSGYKQLNLPDFNQFDNQTVDNIGIASVMFTNLDRDDENEIIILNEGYKKGPQGWTIFNTAVLDWQFYKFREMDKWEIYFDENCEDAKCLKKYINAYFNLFGDYYGENEFIAADMVIELNDKGILRGNWDAGYGEGHMCIFDFELSIIESNWAQMMIPGSLEEIGNVVILDKDNVEVNFTMPLEDLDCGYGHPGVLELQKK